MRQHGTISMYAGGCRCDECRAARRAYDRRHQPDYLARKAAGAPVRRYKKKKPVYRPPLPSAPLLERITSVYGANWNITQVASELGITTQTINRWLKGHSVAEQYADRIAVALGWHPAAIWGADWYIASAVAA